MVGWSARGTTTATENRAVADARRLDARRRLYQLGSGAFAGLVNTIVLNPLDVIKTRLQVQERLVRNGAIRSQQVTSMAVVRSMYMHEGLRSFYRGLGAALCAFVPNWALYWYTYEELKGALTRLHRRNHARQLQSQPGPSDRGGASTSPFVHWIHMLSAVGAGTVTTVTTSPLWVVKTRMQVERLTPSSNAQPRYQGVLSSLRLIMKEEGVPALYKGLFPSLLGLVHVAIQFPLYEKLKTVILPQTDDEDANGVKASVRILLASSLSKVVATVAAYPHEVVRARLQVRESVSTNIFKEIPLALQLARQIYVREGARSLYAGLGANLMRTVPSCMLTFSCYEFARRRLEQHALAEHHVTKVSHRP
ncbi:Mitochondrial substrate carrier family protein W [Porphyridium purpureum]|uniref:Mitochondrial substrate carrier family protein W n=1 Tax=Porphyridium purpureum TaxID=35688 RepID=A0A5J4YNS8_PORPP|nr:Mitochondrial substrate carrier family protein W [Porphyridium purpureum]|eukprot:POR6681..scf295_9